MRTEYSISQPLESVQRLPLNRVDKSNLAAWLIPGIDMQSFLMCLTRKSNENDNFWELHFFLSSCVMHLKNLIKVGYVSDFFLEWKMFCLGMMTKPLLALIYMELIELS